MRILLTNDDGINAPGLLALEKIAHSLSDDVWIVAPESERSGASHSLTLAEPLRLRKLDERRFALSGSPTDCVILACNHVLADGPPDLVLSGVNRGYNVADDVTYSGTVAGAMEGALLGFRSIAFSQSFSKADAIPWATAEVWGPTVLGALLDVALPGGVFLNVNFPALAADAVRGVRSTVQGARSLNQAQVHERIDARGFPYYWLSFTHESDGAIHDADDGALDAGYISVTPLHCNLTHVQSRDQVGAAVGTIKRPVGN